MSQQFSMAASFPPVSLLPAAADAAGRTSAYRSLKNCQKAYVVVEVNQGNGATVALTLLQAKDNAGTGSKAANAVPIWLCADTSVIDTLVGQTAAASFTTSAALKDKLVVFELLPAAVLDATNGFAYIAIQTGASNAANVTEAKLYAQPSFQQSPAPSRY